MAVKDEAEHARRPAVSTIVLLAIVVISIVLAAWVISTISLASQFPTSDFVTLPNQPIWTKGDRVVIVRVSAVHEGGVASGVSGYLQTDSGKPVASATVYITYFLRGAYRTQSTSTDPNGYFEAHFPMNWTGWLPVTLTYFGDEEHQGLRQVFSVQAQG